MGCLDLLERMGMSISQDFWLQTRAKGIHWQDGCGVGWSQNQWEARELDLVTSTPGKGMWQKCLQPHTFN